MIKTVILETTFKKFVGWRIRFGIKFDEDIKIEVEVQTIDRISCKVDENFWSKDLAQAKKNNQTTFTAVISHTNSINYATSKYKTAVAFKLTDKNIENI